MSLVINTFAESRDIVAGASRCFLLGVTWYGKAVVWRLARGDHRGWRWKVGEATRPSAYAPNDWLIDYLYTTVT